jgi:hypothetical protein
MHAECKTQDGIPNAKRKMPAISGKSIERPA